MIVENVAHSIRLDSENRADIGGGDGELELRERVGSFRVEVSPERGRNRPELARTEVPRAAKHHVLLRVRHSLEVRRIVARADEVREVRRYDRRQRIAHDDYAQAVGEGRLEYVVLGCGGSQAGRAQRSGEREDGNEMRNAERHTALSFVEIEKPYRDRGERLAAAFVPSCGT